MDFFRLYLRKKPHLIARLPPAPKASEDKSEDDFVGRNQKSPFANTRGDKVVRLFYGSGRS